MYKPSYVEIATLIGSFGLFFTLFMLFIRYMPIISIGEVKSVLQFKGRSGGEK